MDPSTPVPPIRLTLGRRTVGTTIAFLQDLVKQAQDSVTPEGGDPAYIVIDESVLLDLNFEWTNGMPLHGKAFSTYPKFRWFVSLTEGIDRHDQWHRRGLA